MSSTALEELARALGDDDDERVDALVVTNPTNIRYLTGFTGSAATLIVRATGDSSGSERPVLVTDSRYTIQAADEVGTKAAEVEVQIAPGGGFDRIVELLSGAERTGLEADHVTWAVRDRFATALDGQVVPTSGLVERLRRVKRPDELELMASAAAIADVALVEVRSRLAEQPTEREFAYLLEATMRELGADGPGFETIVASGPNAARPHHRPGDRTIRAGDLVIVDFGAQVGGYRSDMTRTFSIGEPDARSAEMLGAVARAQAAGIAAAGPDVAASAVDAACRQVLAEVELAEFFTHGTGHGVGLDIHEGPSVSSRATGTLAAGNVITVEPGVYVADFGGVRWEDTLVITAAGAEPLTKADKNAIIPV